MKYHFILKHALKEHAQGIFEIASKALSFFSLNATQKKEKIKKIMRQMGK